MTSTTNQTPVAHHEWQKICGGQTPVIVTPHTTLQEGTIAPTEWKRRAQEYRALNKG